MPTITHVDPPNLTSALRRRGHKKHRVHSTPVLVHAGEQNPTSPDSALKGIIAVSAGEGHSIALDVNGFVYAFGCNYYGRAGLASPLFLPLYHAKKSTERT